MTAVTRKPANTDGLYIVVSFREYLFVALTEDVFSSKQCLPLNISNHWFVTVLPRSLERGISH